MSIERRPALPEGPYLVVGLARSGLAAAGALRRRGLAVIGVDAARPQGIERLQEQGVEVHVGSDGLELLSRVGTVIKSPGVPDDAPVVEAARARGIEMLGELELAWRMLPNQLIAVTGTNGKTTTVELIAEIYRHAGTPVAVAGNVGLALSALVDRIDDRVLVVCEASSFQLQDTIAFSPQASVLLNLAPDHLDRHRSYTEYVQAKLAAFSRLRQHDLAVLPLEAEIARALPSGWDSLEQRVRELGGRARIVRFGFDAQAQAAAQGGRLSFDGEPLIDAAQLRIRGSHNIANALASAAVCLGLGVEIGAVRSGLLAFGGVEHRLEEVARVSGVLYVNDSKATNVASTLVALAALAPERDSSGASLEGRGRPAAPARQAGDANAARPHARRRVHVILGGQGKGQDFAALREQVQRTCAAAYLIGEAEAEIAEALAGLDLEVERCGDLEHAVERAGAAARKAVAARRWVAAAQGRAGGEDPEGDEIVLLAPAAASFDQFESYEARGRRFKELVAAP